MDQPNTTTVTETQLELAQVPQVAEESHAPTCMICLESLPGRSCKSCNGCDKQFHYLCLREWLLNDPSLGSGNAAAVPSEARHYDYDYSISRCPNCRKTNPDHSMTMDLKHQHLKSNQILKSCINGYTRKVLDDFIKIGKDIGTQLFHEGKLFNDVYSQTFFSRLVKKNLNKYYEGFSQFVLLDLKYELRKIILTNFVKDNKEILMEHFRLSHHKYVRVIDYQVRESLFMALFSNKLQKFLDNSIQYINHQMKKFVLENLIGQEFPKENKDVFDEIARIAHAQYNAELVNFYSNLTIACADNLIPEERAALATHHSVIIEKEISLPNIQRQVSDCYALNKMKFETSGKDAWISHASEVLANAAGAPPSDLWVFSADEYSSRRVRTRSQGPPQLSDVPPSDSLVVPAAEPTPKRMRTRSQGPPDS